MSELLSHPSGPAWHVVYTGPRAEIRAKEGIEDIGHRVYLPIERLRARSRRQAQERPLFPRYLFVSLDMPYAWGSLLDVDGVCDVLRNNGTLSRVPTAWIEGLQKAESFGIFDRTLASKAPFTLGETVRLSSGPFTGFNAVILKFIAKLRSTTAVKRARVLFDFMGRMTELELPVCDLDKI